MRTVPYGPQRPFSIRVLWRLRARWAGRVAGCHSCYREPYCTAPGVPSAPAFCGGYGVQTLLEYTFIMLDLYYYYFCSLFGVLLIISQLHIGDNGRLPFFLPRTVLYGPWRPLSTRVLQRLRARWVRSVADCHSSYREPHCTAPGIPSAPTFCGGYGTDLAGVHLYNVILLLYFVPYAQNRIFWS